MSRTPERIGKIIAHEAGHAFLCYLYGIRIRGITVYEGTPCIDFHDPDTEQTLREKILISGISWGGFWADSLGGGAPNSHLNWEAYAGASHDLVSGARALLELSEGVEEPRRLQIAHGAWLNFGKLAEHVFRLPFGQQILAGLNLELAKGRDLTEAEIAAFFESTSAVWTPFVEAYRQKANGIASEFERQVSIRT